MVSILYILPRMGFKMEQEKFKNLARIDPWVVNSNNSFSANVQIQRMPSGTGRRFIYDKKPYVRKIKVNNNILKPCTLPNIQNVCLNKKFGNKCF